MQGGAVIVTGCSLVKPGSFFRGVSRVLLDWGVKKLKVVVKGTDVIIIMDGE